MVNFSRYWRIRLDNGNIVEVPFLEGAPQWKDFVAWVQRKGQIGTSARTRKQILDEFHKLFAHSRDMWRQWQDAGFDDDDNNEAHATVQQRAPADDPWLADPRPRYNPPQDLQIPPQDANGWTAAARHAPPQIVAGSHRPPPPQVNLQQGGRLRPQHMYVPARMRPHPNPNMPPPQRMPASGVGEVVTMCNELSPAEQRAFRAQHGANCIMTIHRVDDTGPRRTVTMRTVMDPKTVINVDDEEEEEQDDDDDETVIDQDENNDDDEEEEYYL